MDVRCSDAGTSGGRLRCRGRLRPGLRRPDPRQRRRGQDVMTWQGWLQIMVFAALITAVVRPLGGYIVRSVDGRGKVTRVFAPFERVLYRLAGIDPAVEQGWVEYALALLWFHLVGIAVLYGLLRLQS